MEHDELLEVQVGQCRSYGRSKCWGICALDFDPEAAATPEHEIPPLIGGISWYAMGPVGFEPTTKGFTCPGVSAGSGLSLHPCARGCACGCGMLQACHQGHSSPQVVSAPSAGVPAARLRIAMGDDPEGFPEFIPSTSRVSARRHLVDESPALTAVLQAQPRRIVAAARGAAAAASAALDCGPGTCRGGFPGQPPSAIAAETTTAVTKSDLIAGPSCHRCPQR